MTRRLLACCALSVALLGAIAQQQPAGAAGEGARAGTSRGLVLIADAVGARPKAISDDPVFTRAEKLLRRNGVAEVLGLLGYYSSVSMGMKLHRVPLPAPA